jgi:hypothetical protein
VPIVGIVPDASHPPGIVDVVDVVGEVVVAGCVLEVVVVAAGPVVVVVPPVLVPPGAQPVVGWSHGVVEEPVVVGLIGVVVVLDVVDEVVVVPLGAELAQPVVEPEGPHELAGWDWSPDDVGVVVVVPVVVVPGLVPPPPEGDPDWAHEVTSGPTRKIWTPACFSAPLSASLACL